MRTDCSVAPARAHSVRDVEEAETVGGLLYYPHHCTVLGREADFDLQIETLHVGPLTMGWISYGTEVQVETQDLGCAYQVNVPLDGLLRTSSGEDRIVASAQRAAVYRLDRPSVLHGWDSPQQSMLAIKIERESLEAQLAALLGHPVDDPIAFSLPLDLDVGRGRQWWSLVHTLALQLRELDPLAAHPLLTAPLTHTVMTGLLLAADHPHRAELDVIVAPARPRAVQTAVDWIEQHAADPVSVIDIARGTGMSVRALQQGFHASIGVSPMRFLRDVRLRRVHTDLLAADPERVGVAEIALRWGFGHLGRFAGQYREVYGEAPSVTLKRS